MSDWGIASEQLQLFFEQLKADCQYCLRQHLRN